MISFRMLYMTLVALSRKYYSFQNELLLNLLYSNDLQKMICFHDHDGFEKWNFYYETYFE